jgi:hypothetical protein
MQIRNFDLSSLNSISTFAVSIADYKMVTPTLARVVVTYSGQPKSKEEARAAISKRLKSLGSPVADSFRTLFRNGEISSAIGFVRANAEVVEYSEEALKGKRVMASNLLMDDTDKSMWDVRENAGAKYLVKHGNEDLSQLVHLASARRAGDPQLAQVASERVLEREFAAFVGKDSEEVEFGYVVAGQTDNGETFSVLAMGADTPVDVTPDQVVHVMNFDGDDVKAMGAEVAAVPGMGREALVEYYTKLYGSYAPDYLQKVIDIINSMSFA